ncbi:hypothetical protein FJY93_01545 [Candidatus Kaiserbacteria bacterium]|nr:hypothetical protein [Candidatus Kaiserbacteria bacterium]
MGNFIWSVIVIFLLVIIGVLGWIIFAQPASPSASSSATTTPSEVSEATTPELTPPAPEQPLSARVQVSLPVSGSEVGSTFEVTGQAPGNWYFEASFPVMVRDKDGNKIARTHAQAQTDWMTTELVTFKSTVTIEGGYKGPADLILLRDNPSGLPENDDSITIPIVIK